MATLARQQPPETNLTREDLDAVGHLAMLLQQGTTAKDGYLTLPEERRQAIRGGVLRIVQAMVLLGWIEPPS